MWLAAISMIALAANQRIGNAIQAWLSSIILFAGPAWEESNFLAPSKADIAGAARFRDNVL